jgi:hypothetical protein
MAATRSSSSIPIEPQARSAEFPSSCACGERGIADRTRASTNVGKILLSRIADIDRNDRLTTEVTPASAAPANHAVGADTALGVD